MLIKEPFENIVVRHGATVLRVCRAVLGAADADDAWSETFLAAMRAFPALADDANVEAWLVTIAHRKSIDLVRSRGRRATPVGDVPELGHTPDFDGADPDLVAAFSRLSVRQQTVVALHHLAGLPYVEIAAIIDSTPTATRRAAADGIAALRRTYPQHHRPDSAVPERTAMRKDSKR